MQYRTCCGSNTLVTPAPDSVHNNLRLFFTISIYFEALRRHATRNARGRVCVMEALFPIRRVLTKQHSEMQCCPILHQTTRPAFLWAPVCGNPIWATQEATVRAVCPTPRRMLPQIHFWRKKCRFWRKTTGWGKAQSVAACSSREN